MCVEIKAVCRDSLRPSSLFNIYYMVLRVDTTYVTLENAGKVVPFPKARIRHNEYAGTATTIKPIPLSVIE